MDGQPKPRPNPHGLMKSSSNNSPLRKKSTGDRDMVERYWEKVKVKFG